MSVNEVNPHEAIELLDGDAILLDVREESEWRTATRRWPHSFPWRNCPTTWRNCPTIASSFARVVRADDRYAPRTSCRKTVLRWRI